MKERVTQRKARHRNFVVKTPLHTATLKLYTRVLWRQACERQLQWLQ